MRKFDDALATEVVRLHLEDGDSALRISRLLRANGVHLNSNDVRGILATAGVMPRAGVIGARRAELPNLEELAERFAEGAGETLEALAAEAGVTGNTLKRHLAEAGHIRRFRRTRDGRVIPYERKSARARSLRVH